MKKFILILILLTSCGEQAKQHHELGNIDKDTTIQKISNQENTSAKQDAGDEFIDLNKFRVARQDSFSLQDWYYGARQKKLVKLTEQEIRLYFQDSELKNNPDEGNYYYFSFQRKDKDKKIITLIEEYDYCCADLLLMAYDQHNQLIGKSKVAGTGGDGGWGYNEYGRFLSDSLYRLIRVDETTLRDDPDTMEYKIDSVVTRFSVDKHLNFENLNEEKFQRKKIVVN